MACCLDHYKNIRTSLNWELIVVDNGSSDGTVALVRERQRRAVLPLVLVAEPAAGLSRARNAGLRRARGEILCFSDDDCYPDPGLIDAWAGVFADPAVDFAGGRIELFDPADAEFTIKTDPLPVSYPPGSLILPGTLHGASLAFRRRVIERLGGFDVRLGAGARFCSAEDSDYVQRASESGFAGLYSPIPLVRHHHGRKPQDIPPLRAGYERGRGAFYAAVMTRSPRTLWNAVVEDYRRNPGLLGYPKSLYWRYRFRMVERCWNMVRGAVEFAISEVGRRDRFELRLRSQLPNE